MPHDPEKYLFDVRGACDFLLAFTRERTVDDYAQDRGFRSAVERELQIIGEAIMQLERVAPSTAARISEHHAIIGFRHVLVHGYDSLHPATVWNVIEAKLPVLAREVRDILHELEGKHRGSDS